MKNLINRLRGVERDIVQAPSGEAPYYEPQGNETRIFEAAFKKRLPVMLKGPTGCGKTRFVEHMAHRLGKPLVTVSCHEDLTSADLVGRFLLEGDKTVWQDGPLTRAVKAYYDGALGSRGARLLADYAGAVAVMSFDPRVPEWFADRVPEMVRGLVGTDTHENGFEGEWRKPEVLAQAQPDFLAIDVRDLTLPEAAAWRAGGKPLLTWTVRSPGTRATGLAYADALIAEGEGLA